MIECVECQRRIEPAKTGRPARFCGSACRYRHRDRQRPPDRRKRKRPQRLREPRPIVGIDSETEVRNGRTHLTLVASSDGRHIAGRDISSNDALQFIVDAGKVQLWTFFGDYDINFWVRDFGGGALDILRRTGWCRYGNWKIHHIPRRIFEVWNRHTKQYAAVFDAFPFVQTSFVKWLRDWKLTDEKTIAHIQSMKEQRSDFAKLPAARILRYTQDEVRFIALGVSVLQERIRNAECAPPRWLGPGAVASVVLRRERVKDFMPKRTTPKKVLTIGEAAYFGGRIETGALGHVEGPLYQYDINSAYPHAAATLPCFRHGTWTNTKGRLDPNEPIALVRAHWKPKRGRRPVWGPAPHRRAQGVSLRYFKHGTGGWFWLDELRPWLTDPQSPYVVTIKQAWVWRQSCNHAPFAFVPELYARRRALKSVGDPSEYAFKLILNSCYGKLAQRVGSAPFQCKLWAGIITARTRARLAEVLIRYPQNVFVVATDGILSNVRLDLPLDSKQLGAWDMVGEYAWADIWQPGFYILPDGTNGVKVKTRGFLADDIDPQQFRDAFAARRWFGKVEIGRNRVLGYRLATHWGRPDDVGMWIRDTAQLSFNPQPRRMISHKRGYLFDADENIVGMLTVARDGRSRSKDDDDKRLGVAWDKQRLEAEYLSDGIAGGFSTG